VAGLRINRGTYRNYGENYQKRQQRFALHGPPRLGIAQGSETTLAKAGELLTKRGDESIGKPLRIVNTYNSTSAKPAMQPLGDSRATKLDVVAGETRLSIQVLNGGMQHERGKMVRYLVLEANRDFMTIRGNCELFVSHEISTSLRGAQLTEIDYLTSPPSCDLPKQ